MKLRIAGALAAVAVIFAPVAAIVAPAASTPVAGSHWTSAPKAHIDADQWT